MSYGRGLHRPDPKKLARRMHAAYHPLLAGGTPKGKAQLTPCPRLDQGASGTCHAHSAAGSIWTAFKAAGQEIFVPSPRVIASTTYAEVRAAAYPTGPLPQLQDTGADLSDDATALAEWGVAPIQAPTSDGRYSDVENDKGWFPEPDLGRLLIAGADLISGEYQIPVDSSAPSLCALSLDGGIPIWLGFFVDSAFQSLGPSSIAQPPDTSDPSGGGHAVYLSGYRTASSGQYEFLLQNSWGSGWAGGGAVWCSQAWLLACWMLWPMVVVPKQVT